MERIQVLIDKLVQQKRAGESAAQLLYTVQLLQTELLQKQQQKETLSSRKVSVVMPANFAVQQTENVAAPAPAAEKTTPPPVKEPEEKETFFQPQVSKAAHEIETKVQAEEPPVTIPEMQRVEAPAYQAPVQKVEPRQTTPQQNDLFSNQSYTLKRPAILQPEETSEAAQPVLNKIADVIPPHPVTTPPPAEPQPFDALAETPTLLQHIPPQVEKPKEINQLIAQQQPSLNDRLKQENVELAHKLKDAPIKDLRKGIGINDRFVFVSELFRGDEAMYERSIKTINSFHILQEAEYWMNRELKVKLGWNDSKDTVQHFYALVRRRFS